MLKVENVVKTYGENQVLKGVNLEVKKGEIYGLIGANGAGKSTLFNIIAQILTYDEGEIRIDGEKINTINDLSNKVGYIIDIPSLFEYMNAYEYLEFLYSSVSRAKHEIINRSNEVLELVGLKDVGTKKIQEFSRGMKQRMGIAAGLIFKPELIIMDEPSSALDPQGRNEVLKIIENLKNQGKTIVLSTHILNDIERVCTKVGLLINGKITIEGNLEDILKKHTDNILKVVCDEKDREILLKSLKEINLHKNTKALDNGIEIEFKDSKQKKEILNIIVSSEISFTEVSLKRRTLEDIYLLESKGGK